MSAPGPAVYDPRPEVEDGPDGVVLLGMRCADCGYAVAGERPRCPRCRGLVAPARFGPGGVVWSSTVVRVPVPGRTPPYGLAYVDLDDDGPRILAHTGADAAIPVGGRVRLAAKNDEGDLVVEVVA